ncbi:MAG: A24 family peptidase [Methanobrevibacter sp.]|jgi:preflagellin peptidase FlaK|nr:A24 family peptidase [Candidatus Methanovirga aequatorialis]
MMDTIILVTIISFGTLIGAIYDIKRGIIPNKLNFFLIIVGIVINIILSITYKDVKYIEFSVTFGVVTFIFGYWLWRIGFWGGGDVKLITAIAIFLPFEPTIYSVNLSGLNVFIPVTAIYPFPMTIFLNGLILSLPSVIFYLIMLNLRKTNDTVLNLITNTGKTMFNKKNSIKLVHIFREDVLRLKTLKMIVISLFISTIIVCIQNTINGEIKPTNLFFNSFLIGLGLFIFSRSLMYSFKYLKNFLLNRSTITLSINDIEEGTIVQNLQIPKELEKEVKISLKSLRIEYLENGSKTIEPTQDTMDDDEIKTKLNYPSVDELQLIVNSRHASGLNQFEAEFLKDLANRGLIKDRVDVKIAVPYGPSLFMGLLSGIIFGDLCSLLMIILKSIILKSML